MWVSVSKMAFLGVEDVTLLHEESTCFTVLRVVVRTGVSRKKPAPAMALPTQGLLSAWLVLGEHRDIM